MPAWLYIGVLVAPHHITSLPADLVCLWCGRVAGWKSEARCIPCFCQHSPSLTFGDIDRANFAVHQPSGIEQRLLPNPVFVSCIASCLLQQYRLLTCSFSELSTQILLCTCMTRACVCPCRQVKCMTGKDRKRTLIKHGTRHSCRIDETIQLQVTTSHQQAGMQTEFIVLP